MSSATFTLFSNDLGGQATIDQEFNGFGCVGNNISPQLSWTNPPAQAQSFALTLYDPDAPTGSGWWHWLVFNIPADIREIPQGAGHEEKQLLPDSVIQSVTDYGTTGYGGPCPPQGHGYHQYVFTLYALNTNRLDLDKNTNPAVVGFNINAHTIAKASLVVYYKRD